MIKRFYRFLLFGILLVLFPVGVIFKQGMGLTHSGNSLSRNDPPVSNVSSHFLLPDSSTTERVSVASDGTQGNGYSNWPTNLVEVLNKQTGGSVRISYHAETGKVRFIGTDPSHPIPQPGKVDANTSPEDAARQFLATYGSLFGLSDPVKELSVERIQASDQKRSFVRFQQVYNKPISPAIPVMGGELIVQLNAAKDVLSVSGEILPDIKTDPTPAISLLTARQRSREHSQGLWGQRH